MYRVKQSEGKRDAQTKIFDGLFIRYTNWRKVMKQFLVGEVS